MNFLVASGNLRWKAEVAPLRRFHIDTYSQLFR
jgi:hypothetical protein